MLYHGQDHIRYLLKGLRMSLRSHYRMGELTEKKQAYFEKKEKLFKAFALKHGLSLVD